MKEEIIVIGIAAGIQASPVWSTEEHENPRCVHQPQAPPAKAQRTNPAKSTALHCQGGQNRGQTGRGGGLSDQLIRKCTLLV